MKMIMSIYEFNERYLSRKIKIDIEDLKIIANEIEKISKDIFEEK